MKIRPEGAELFRADRQVDGRTDRHDGSNSRFSQFSERANKLVLVRKIHDTSIMKISEYFCSDWTLFKINSEIFVIIIIVVC
jgi:hypothetical protein